MGADTFAFAQALYVVDVFQRGRIALERLFATPYPPALAPATGDLWATLEEFMRVVALGHALDPVTTELVRLRGARAHQCRICQSRLSLRAVEAAGSEALFATTPTTRRLTDRQRAALDARRRGDLAARVHRRRPRRPGLRAHLTDAEIVEIVLDLVRNAANKIAVSLGGDEAVVTDGIEFYDVDRDG